MTNECMYFSRYVKKKVFVILKNKRTYAGLVESVEDVGNGLVWIGLIKKGTNQLVTFASGEIEVMEEEL
jgi:hypothetical protein